MRRMDSLSESEEKERERDPQRARATVQHRFLSYSTGLAFFLDYFDPH